MSTRRRRSSWWRGLLPLAMVLTDLIAPVHVAAAGLSLTSQHLTTSATCALVSYPSSSLYSTDSYVTQGTPSQNNGTATQLTIASSSANNERVYVRYDLTKCQTAPPAQAIVRSATLRLFLTALPPACNTMAAFRAGASWGDTTVTWTNQPAGTTINQPTLAGATSQSVTVGTPVGCAIHTASTYVSWDVKTDVTAFLATPATSNYGWMIRDATEGQATTQTIQFAAADLGTLAQAPQLLITYSLV